MTPREKVPENRKLLDLLENLKKINKNIESGEYIQSSFLLEGTLNNYYDAREYNDEVYIGVDALHHIKDILEIRKKRNKYELLLERIREFKIFVKENKLLFNELKIKEDYRNLLNFINHLEKLKNNLYEEERSYALSLKNTYDDLKQQTRRLVGLCLERIWVPDIIEAKGYLLRPSILPIKDGEIELDAMAEKDNIKGIAPSHKLISKSILVVETKATIDRKDIFDFLKKVEIVKKKYNLMAAEFGFSLSLEAWIVACYGWDQKLKEYANSNDILPIDDLKLFTMMEENGLLDSRYNPCPST